MKKTILNLLSSVDIWLFNFLAKRHLMCFCLENLFGGGNTTIEAPEPIDIRNVITEYVGAVSDPVLRDQILQAERTDRPLFRALDLQDIGTIARGLGERANPEYQRIQSRIQALKAGDASAAGAASEEELRARAKEIYPIKKAGRNDGKKEKEERKRQQALQDDYVQERLKGVSGQNAAEIAELEAQLASTPQRLGRTEGLFDLQDAATRRAGVTTREALDLQREDDVSALERLGERVVTAQRAADPASTRLAEMASARAGQATNVGRLGEFLMGTAMDRTKDPSAAERALQSRGMADLNARREAASAAERQLQTMGMTLGDLSPTEQEALISGRGTEFIQSTGELSPLEQRRVQQSARQASLARGRELGQGALAQEIANRFAEESGKREREIALGAQLLGQEASLRGARLGQGAGMLTQSEALAAQRRAEQLQRQQLGTQTLGLTEDMAARRRAEELQRFQLGAGLVGQEEGIQSGRFSQAFGMNRSLSGDLGATILGRPSYATQLGGQILGSAQQGAQQSVGPKLYDPNMGLNMAMQDRQNQFGLLGAQAQADATLGAGRAQMAGQIAAALICWVAREVYGIENPKWIQFRNWMLNDSPSWFLNLYIKYGERFAKFISNKPVLKNIIRKWMNTKIK